MSVARRNMGLVAVGIFLLLFGLIFSLAGYFIIIDSLDIEQTWGTTTGTIMASEIVNNGEGYTAYIRYSYQVGGRSYQSDSVYPGGASYSSSDSSEFEALVEKYPVGASVTVYYNPSDPEQSALETDIPGFIWIFPGIGLFFVFMSIVLIIVGLRVKERPIDYNYDSRIDIDVESEQLEYSSPIKSLYSCKHCGDEISLRAKFCDNCGGEQ
ncbi:MAG: DUF3592 domain-containing protein [Candidatus Heimdallarchaeota archaeon]|nr:DUF3592 domain-containing protein [Candidatus Heimdallarchaeota archaeon]